MSTWLTNRRAFESLFQATPTGIVALDRDATVVDANPAWLAMTRYTRDQVAGRDIREMFSGTVVEFVQDALDAAARDVSIKRQTAVSRTDGSIFLADVMGVPVPNGSTGVDLFLVFDEIGAHGETQLQTNFRLLFEHNPAVVISLDMQHRIADINSAGVRISGYGRHELVGQEVVNFVPPSHRDRVRSFLNQALRGETVTFPADAYGADGRLIQYEATLVPIVSNDEIGGVYALLEDVTQRMRAERTVAAQREEILDLEHDFRSLFDRNPDGIIVLAIDGMIVDVNQAVLQTGGRSRDQVVGQNFRAFLQGPNLERGWTFFRRAVDGESVRFEITSSRADGRVLPLDITLFPKYAQGLVVGVYCVMQDIAERKLVHRKLEMQTQRVRDLYLLATTPEYTDAQVMTTLQTGCRLLGMESGAIVDTTDTPRIELRYDSLELFSGDDLQVIELSDAVLQKREPVISQVTGEAGVGGFRSWIGSRLMVSGALHGTLLFFSSTQRDQDFEEIDHDTLALMGALVGSALERRRTRSRLRTLAYYDSLTGLPNRLLFQERLRDALLDPKGMRRSAAVLFFDLDRFKDINDTLGHAMGDRFLQIVAHRLSGALGEDGLVARMGGDEFIVLAPGCADAENAADLAQTLLRAIEEPYRIDGYEQYMTSSVGISLYPADGRDDQALIKNADIAMYQAKDRGGNGYFFYQESLEAPMRSRLAQEKDLRRAIMRGQFTLQYQPIVEVASDKIVGVEALVRWNDPRRGVVMPDEFIPTAEATGLIVQLGEHIIAVAAAQMREWHDRLGPLTLAVNISARQFHQTNLAERVAQLLQESGLPPGFLEIEITESMALSDVTHAIDALAQLKRAGMHIAVDDFGTGHSSLSYLRRFDVDQIKIDRSFVAGIGSERSDETIVKAIIAMGHSLGLKVVAEGVETQEQYAFLRDHGCDRVQGYHFSRPLDAAALEALVVERGTRSEPG